MEYYIGPLEQELAERRRAAFEQEPIKKPLRSLNQTQPKLNQEIRYKQEEQIQNPRGQQDCTASSDAQPAVPRISKASASVKFHQPTAREVEDHEASPPQSTPTGAGDAETGPNAHESEASRDASPEQCGAEAEGQGRSHRADTDLLGLVTRSLDELKDFHRDFLLDDLDDKDVKRIEKSVYSLRLDIERLLKNTIVTDFERIFE